MSVGDSVKRPAAGRSSRAYRAAKAAMKAARCQPCWLCGQAIDYDAPPQSPDSFEPDHLFPVSTHPELADDPGNLIQSHSQCNRARGNGDPFVPVMKTTRQW